MTRLLFVTGTALLLSACSQPADDPAARGAELLAPFKAELKSALQAGMEDGPAAAIEVCSEKAPEIAASLSVDGVSMGRSSHKLRDPTNTAPTWLEFGTEPVVADLGDGRHGYAEPIFTQPLCLVCHGSVISPEVAASIEERYPEDEATGFEVGDLRGMFWVEF